MGKPSKRQRRAIHFRVERRKLKIKETISANLSKPRTETSPEALRVGIKPINPLPFSSLRHLLGRAVDISPQALRSRSHKGMSSGGITKTKKTRKRFKPFSEPADMEDKETFTVKRGNKIIVKGTLPTGKGR